MVWGDPKGKVGHYYFTYISYIFTNIRYFATIDISHVFDFQDTFFSALFASWFFSWFVNFVSGCWKSVSFPPIKEFDIHLKIIMVMIALVMIMMVMIAMVMIMMVMIPMEMITTHRQQDKEDEKILKSSFKNLFNNFYVFLLAHSLAHSPWAFLSCFVLDTSSFLS